MSKKYTILIVEDEEAMRMALSDKLNNENFNVISASDGEEGAKLALAEHPDVILLDIIMPKMSGLEVLQKIREDMGWGQDVPVIMLTNINDPESVAEASKYNVYDFLVKTDWRLNDVVRLISEKLDIVS